MSLLLFLQLSALSGLRGVADTEGYPLNTSKKFALNTYEDDGILGLYAALGFNQLHSDRFSYLFGIGGPVLHLAKPVMTLMASLGFFSRFEDPRLYQLYPNEFQKAYKSFALYQLLFFTLWLPAAGWLVLGHHISRSAGIWGAWLLALMPFFTGFETRIKPDTAALLFCLLSFYYTLCHIREGKQAQLLAGWGFLGLSSAIKPTCVPLLLLLTWLALAGARQHGGKGIRNVIYGICCYVAVFFIANPLIILGTSNIVATLFSYIRDMHSIPAPEGKSVHFYDFLYRLFTLQVFFGPFLRWAYPIMLFSLAIRWIWIRFSVTVWSVLLVACLLQIVYMIAVAGDQVIHITYYFYTSSAFGMLLFAFCLDWIQSSLVAHKTCSRGATILALSILIFVPLALVNINTALYVSCKTNRQLCLSWIEANLPEDSRIGVPLSSDSQPINQHLRVDPFRYQVMGVGKNFELLNDLKPRYLVRISNKLDEIFQYTLPGYNLMASFTAGNSLPRDRIGLFQDEAYQVFECVNELEPPVGESSWENAIGRLARRDQEPNFAILSYQASRFYPISLEMFRKQGRTLLPLPAALFASSVRHHSSPLSYVHQVGPTVLALWGVKYIWAKLDSSFNDNVMSATYDLEQIDLPCEGDCSGNTHAVFLNRGYLGQALFIPEHPWEQLKAPKRWLRTRSLPRAGVILEGNSAQTVEVRIEVEADGPVDVLLKGGTVPHSFLLGRGRSVLLVPYESSGSVEYEVNSVNSEGMISLLSAAVRPMNVLGAPVAYGISADPEEAFARVAAPSAGRVVFSLPWHTHWEAEVDGQVTHAELGPAGTVAIPVDAGRHFLALRYKR
jgi:hypothetical protein